MRSKELASMQLLPTAEAGDTATVVALLARGADVDYGKTNDGYGFWRLHRRVADLPQCRADGPSTRGGAAGVAVWPCRVTALQVASVNGRTETAMALVKAGADVHCKTNDGYGR
jgi:hypothetical protein